MKPGAGYWTSTTLTKAEAPSINHVTVHAWQWLFQNNVTRNGIDYNTLHPHKSLLAPVILVSSSPTEPPKE